MNIKYSLIPDIKDYVKVLKFEDSEVGLKGFIAIHNTNLGPALGGTRIYNYKDEEEALEDVLSLSRAMTYKCAIAGLPFGGGKAVIISDNKNIDKEALLRSYAAVVDSLEGEFYTGEDVGLTESDVQYMLKYSTYFIGNSDQAGDPSPYAALSAFLCIKETLKFVYGDDSINKRTFVVKGLGKTGSALVDMLMKEGADIKAICDTNSEKIEAVHKLYPNLKTVSGEEIFKIEAEVYCPCALGGDISSENINEIKAKIIVGTANNQLKDKTVAQKLFEAGILHVPDYVANSGGLIDVADELTPDRFDRENVLRSINKIPDILNKILSTSKKEMMNPDVVTDLIAQKIFNKVESQFDKAISSIKALLSYEK